MDLHTGKRKWHFQLVHHGIWDYDLPCAPILADITVEGKRIKAVAQASKQGFLYVLDRVTGQPVWPIVERPVEKGTVPGEWYSPTQPFPTKPPPFELQGIQEKDLIDFAPEMLAEAKKVAANIKLGPLFTPPIVAARAARRHRVHCKRCELAWWLVRSGPGLVYSFQSLTRLLVLANEPKRSDMDYINTGGGGDTGGGGGGPGCTVDAMRDHVPACHSSNRHGDGSPRSISTRGKSSGRFRTAKRSTR